VAADTQQIEKPKERSVGAAARFAARAGAVQESQGCVHVEWFSIEEGGSHAVKSACGGRPQGR
jgi:hypothetical protein